MVHDRPALVISGADVLGAEAGCSGGYGVRVRLTAEGSHKFEEFTRRNVGRRIATIRDGRLISVLTIMEAIRGSIFLYAGEHEKDAVALEARINGRELADTDAQ